MENKKHGITRKVSIVLVSAICILLASSFVFHTVAEASVLTYSLQGASFGNPILDDGSVSSVGLDRALIDNYSVTAQNQYVLSGDYDSFGTPFPQFSDYSTTTGFSYTGFDDVVYVLCSTATNSGTVTATFYSLTSIFTREVIGGSVYHFSDDCYFVRIDGQDYIYDYDGNLLITLESSSYSKFCYGLYTFENKIFVCRGRKTSSSSNTAHNFYVYDCDTFSLLYFITASNSSGTAKQRSCCFLNGSIYLLAGGNVWVFDCSNYDLSQSYSVTGDILSSDGKHIYVFSGTSVYVYDFEFSLIQSYSLSSSVSASANIATAPYFYGSFFVLRYNSSSRYYSFYPLSKSNQYYTDFSAHFVDSFTPSKWINFSCKPSSDGSVVGGDAVSIKLDYALSDEYLATVYTYGVKVSGCTMLASLDDLSTGIGYYGLPPLVVKVNGSVVPRITKQYESVEKVGDVYLYAFSAFCDFQGSTKINSLEIYMNCYVPEQLSRHSFSLPVSHVELYLEPVGGGTGGESSDTSSGGGGGTSSDSSSGGTSSENHPSDMPPEWERNSVEFWFKNQTQDFFLGTYDMWDADTLQVYFGGYAVGSMEPVPTRIRFLKNDVVTEEIRFENLVFQGWSYSSSLSSFEYPTFSGRFVTVPLDSSRRIYLTDYLSNPQLFIADYGAGMLALVNFDSTDSYLTVVNSETLETTITVNNSTVESMIIYGKVMEYSFFTLSEYISWQPYEEGGVYIHANDWLLYDDVYAGLYLHTYITETPPPTVDWWVEYSMELEAERSRLAELESKANQLYGDVSYDPLDDAGFVDAISSYTGVIATDAADGVFSLIQKMWSANPYFTYFVAITVGVCCCMFYLRKL